MSTHSQIAVLLVILCGLDVARAVLSPNFLDGIHQKFEFQNSFKPPMLTNSKGQIPFWDRSGGMETTLYTANNSQTVSENCPKIRPDSDMRESESAQV